jgi:carboxyl-terminal processing protease
MYVEKVDSKKVKEDLVIGMYNSLSPIGLYQPESIFKKFNITPSNKSSIGVHIKFKKGKIIIDSVLANSGAEKAGLIKKDEVLSIDNNNLEDVFYYSDFSKITIGEKNSSCELKIKRDISEDTITLTIKRLPIKRMGIIPIPFINSPNSIVDYNKALKLFDELYPDSIGNEIITENGIRYMLEQLDPHSTYISLKDLHDMNAPLKGSFTGVGIRFQIFKDTIMVVQAIPGGPSEKVGLMAGDKIVSIDNELVAGKGIKNSGVRERLLGDKGTTVEVGVKRGISNELLDFNIIRDKIPIYSVDASYMVNKNTGYIKLNNFSSTSISEIRKSVFELRDNGMENLILDLQNNGGGYLRTAVDLADELLPGNKKIVSTKGRQFPERVYNRNNLGLLEKGKVIVLVNESSASASEIVSGAIQDWDRGLIVGRRTFGKGLVQKPIDLPDGTQVRITTSKYYTPSGRCIQKPYNDGSVAYRKEKYERYKSGESFNLDSVKYNKNEIFKTLVKKRDVYGGGGIIPDYFIPLDTTGTSPYFSKLIRKGIFNQFALYYVNKNREKLEKKYTNFEDYNNNFNSDQVVKELIKYAEGEKLEFNKKEFLKAEKTINIRLKANIAQDLFDYKKFYQVINELNSTLQKSLKIMEDEKAFSKLATIK